MDLIYFTKFLKGLSIQEVGDTAWRMGFAGLDLAVRSGQAVNPENVVDALPEAVKLWQSMGLSVPLVTLETGAVNPEDPCLVRMLEACGANGIGRVKLGYWHWRRGDPWPDRVTAIRKALDGFARIAQRSGVTCLVHTHSGNSYGCSAASVLALVEGQNPAHVAVYLDPGHLSVSGEPLPMALSMLGSYLGMVAAKNPRYLPGGAEEPRWKLDWCSISEGLVDWKSAIRDLREAGYSGPISVHGEYSGPEDLDRILGKVSEDRLTLEECLRA